MPTKLAADLLHFTEMVGHLDTPEAVLEALDAITWMPTRVHVLGASLLPLSFGTTDSLVVGKTVFLHKSESSNRHHVGKWAAFRRAPQRHTTDHAIRNKDQSRRHRTYDAAPVGSRVWRSH